MLSMGNQELETGRYSIHDFDYFSFPLILELPPSNKDHSLKYTKQPLVLLLFLLTGKCGFFCPHTELEQSLFAF